MLTHATARGMGKNNRHLNRGSYNKFEENIVFQTCGVNTIFWK